MNSRERTADSIDSANSAGRPTSAVAARLKHERERHGWSQGELAARIGTNQVTVSRWEHGNSNPSPYFRQRLAETFGKSLEELGFFIDEEDNRIAHPRANPAAFSPDALPTSLWNVPYRRNPYFTGRKEILSQVFAALGSSGTAALTQAHAINGLGGIGKTQVAVEYAYRYREQYSGVMWVTASSRETLIAEFVMLAALLDLPEKNDQDQDIALSAVKRWLTTHSGWLLILDNVDDLKTIDDLLPRYGTGNILLTTRLQALGPMAQGIAVDKMEKDEGVFFLLRRTKLLAAHVPLAQAKKEYLSQAAAIVTELDALPLALDQAGAYIEETRCGLHAYLDLYQSRQRELLFRRGSLPTDHPEPVAATWSLSFQAVEHESRAAADLLCLLAFLGPESIPEEILTEGASELGPELGPVANDPMRVNDFIELLLRYSLIWRIPEERLLSIHRLVQAVLKAGMNKELARAWAERAIRAINRTFPEVQTNTWECCKRCLPHVLAMLPYLDEYHLAFPEFADLLNKAAVYLVDHAQFAQAEPLLTKALTIREQTTERGHPELARILNDLGALYLELGKYRQAAPLLKRAREIRQQHLGSEHPETATSLVNLGRLYFVQGQYDQAEEFYEASLRIRQATLPPAHPDIVLNLNYLAELSTVQARFEQAESFYAQAQAIQQKTSGQLYVDVAKSLNSRAFLYRKKGAYKQAEQYYVEALNIQKQYLREDHPDIAVTLNDLGRLYRAQGDYVKAEPCYQEALKIREHAFGLDHPLVAKSCYNLAKLYRSQGRYTQAEELCQRALRIQERALGEYHPDIAYTLDTLARLYLPRQRYAESGQLYQRSLDIRIAAFGEDHPNVALTLSTLGEVYLAEEKYLEARPFIEQSLEIRERTLGKDHPYIAYNYMNLAETYRLEGSAARTQQQRKQAFAEAIRLYRKALANRENSLGPEHPLTATTYHTLAAFYYIQRRYDLAESLFRAALAIREKALTPEHPDLADTLDYLSRVFSDTERETLATEFQARAQAIKSWRKRKSLELEN